jgi:hypothetical protein
MPFLGGPEQSAFGCHPEETSDALGDRGGYLSAKARGMSHQDEMARLSPLAVIRQLIQAYGRQT